MAKSREWEEVVSTWESSGLSQARFCAEHSVSKTQFSYWKNKLRRSEESTAKFTRVDTGNLSSFFELFLPTGTRVRVPTAFHAESLKRLLEVVQ